MCPVLCPSSVLSYTWSFTLVVHYAHEKLVKTFKMFNFGNQEVMLRKIMNMWQCKKFFIKTYFFNLKYFIMNTTWRRMKNMLLGNSFLETELIHSERKLIKARNTSLKITSRNPWNWQDSVCFPQMMKLKSYPLKGLANWVAKPGYPLTCRYASLLWVSNIH